MKKIFRSLAILFSIVCLGIILLIGVVATDYGTKQVLAVVDRITGNQLTYQEVKGNLLGPLELRNVRYQNEGLTINVAQIYLAWQPKALLQKKLVIDVLSINHLLINQHADQLKKSEPSKKFTLKILPIHIKQLSITDLSLQKNSTPQWLLAKLSGAITIDHQLSVDLTATNKLPLPFVAQLKLTGEWQNYSWWLDLKSKDINQLVLSGVGNLNGSTFKTNEASNPFFGGTIQSKGEIDWSPQLHWQVYLQAKKINLPFANLSSASFNLDTQGTPQRFELAASQIEGHYQHNPITGYLNLKAVLPSNQAVSSSNHDEIKNILKNSQVQINSNLQLGLIQADFLGELNQHWDLRFEVQVPELNKITNAAKGSLKLRGKLTGDPIAPDIIADLDAQKVILAQLPSAAFKGKLRLNTTLQPKGCDYLSLNEAKSLCRFQLHATLQQSEISLQNDGKILHFPLAGDLHSLFSPNGLTADLKLLLHAKPFLDAQVALPGYRLGQSLPTNQAVNGDFTVMLNHTQLGGYPMPIKNLAGNLTAHVKLNGTIHQPTISGNALLLSPVINISEYNLQLTKTRLAISAAGNQLEYTGTTYSGKNPIQLKGQSVFKDKKFDTHLSLTGQNFLASNTHQLKLYVSPDLKIYNNDQNWHITGTIDIPRANIHMPDTTEIVTLPSETVIISSNQKKTTKTPIAIFVDVLVRLGQNIEVNSRGFIGKLAGEVAIKDAPGQPRIANGEIKVIKGVYNIRGDQLKIDHGYARFDNSLLDNPSLDVEASKLIKFHDSNQTTFDSQDLRVGARISGTAEHPVIKLFSDPANWSQADILSFLILGQPASTSSSSGPNLQLLMRTAQLLRSGNSSGFSITSIQNNLQNSLGLSEFDFVSGIDNSDGSQQSSNSFLIGKNLTPRLFISYSIGILNAINTLRLKFLLKNNWYLQTDASVQGNGADIIYSIKR